MPIITRASCTGCMKEFDRDLEGLTGCEEGRRGSLSVSDSESENSNSEGTGVSAERMNGDGVSKVGDVGRWEAIAATTQAIIDICGS